MKKVSKVLVILLMLSTIIPHGVFAEAIEENTDENSIESVENDEQIEIEVEEETEVIEVIEEESDSNSDEIISSEDNQNNSTEEDQDDTNVEETNPENENGVNIDTTEEDIAEENEEVIPDIQTQSIMMFSFNSEVNTSRLGHIRSANTKIYKDLANLSSSFEASSSLTNAVYYIKSQSKVNGTTYYLISTSPSKVKGVVGWIKASDLSTHAHVGVNIDRKTLYFTGKGKAFTKAWGGNKDLVHGNMSKFKGQEFKVHLTEKVGNNTWYRGSFNGQTIWLHSSYLTTIGTATAQSKTSLLGHLRGGAQIFKNIGDNNPVTDSGTYGNAVYYIKSQAKQNNQTYYLISTSPSSSKGVVGWVNAKQLSTHAHKGVDKKAKTLYFTGKGKAFTKAWGGSKNLIHDNMSKFKGQEFKIHLTERVGNNTWYRGSFNGETIWVHSSQVTMPTESKTSKLGHLRANGKIYPNLGDESTVLDGNKYNNAVYYIKKQTQVNDEVFYLISTSPSSTKGVIGWVNAAHLSTNPHVGVDKNSKTHFIKGTGSAYSKAWGGTKDVVYQDLSKFQNQEFKVNLTEKVGNNTWYRGTLDGKTAWIHASYLNETRTVYTNIGFTLNEAVNEQVGNSNPQTDKYRALPGYINSLDADIIQTAVTTGGVNFRNTPSLLNKDNISATVREGTEVIILEEVTGDLFSGSNKWYKINYDKKTLYVHTKLIKTNAKVVKTKVKKDGVNVHESTNTKSHVYSTHTKESTFTYVKSVNGWYEVKLGVWRNAKPTDVEENLNPNNTDDFQHLLLTSSVGVSAAELNKVLNGKGKLQGTAQAFIDGGRAHSVNEVYLISHALLETGNGGSALSKGVEVGKDKNGKLLLVNSTNKGSLKEIKKVYNMFGIKAFDNCALDCGAKHAYAQGWDTPSKAIIGGAKFIGQDYIHNQYKQNTIYKMRWNFNPGGLWKQYATDVGWASKQVYRIKDLYGEIDNPTLHFDKPSYK